MWPAILNAALERTKIEEEGVKRTTSSMDKDFLFVAKSERERDELACECEVVAVERDDCRASARDDCVPFALGR
jgi:hypothetical protein